MQLLPLVKLDVLVNHLRQLVDAFAQFDTMFADGTIDSHHFVLFPLIDNLDLLDALNLLSKEFVALLA